MATTQIGGVKIQIHNRSREADPVKRVAEDELAAAVTLDELRHRHDLFPGLDQGDKVRALAFVLACFYGGSAEGIVERWRADVVKPEPSEDPAWHRSLVVRSGLTYGFSGMVFTAGEHGVTLQSTAQGLSLSMRHSAGARLLRFLLEAYGCAPRVLRADGPAEDVDRVVSEADGIV
jgi:hypothetical protein